MRHFLWILLLAILILSPSPALKAQQDLVEMNVRAGFDGRFRHNLWMPIQVNITNNGDPIEGRLVVRPERSNALTNVFSTPVSLATGASQVIFLYATMNSFGRSLRVELFDADGLTAADVEVPVQSLLPRDSLYVVVSDAPVNGVDLSQIATPEQQAVQVDWFVQDLPDMASALEAINAIVFSSADTGALTSAQREALQAWVAQGGHLIVTGGVNWEPTAAGLRDLLPLDPQSAEDIEGVDALLRFSGDYQTTVDGTARASTGALMEGAQVLASNADGVPLVARRALGAGTVDYVTLDPALAPLRGWSNISALWTTLLASAPPHPVWANGILTTETANTALSILPGVTALPETLAMVAFLAAYVLLVGPINYFVLSRINRRELAWLTIPLLIGLFTVIAWGAGFNLRGSDAILNRLSVVQVWPDAPQAYSDQLIGVLAPRRTEYTLALDEQRALRPLPANQPGLLTTAASGVNISQTDVFAARDFAVDASYVAGFMASGPMLKPALNVDASVSFDTDVDPILMRVRGSVRNDLDVALRDVVLLTNGASFRLDRIEPNTVFPFEVQAPLSNSVLPAAPSPLEMPLGSPESASQGYFYRRGYATLPTDQTVREVLNTFERELNSVPDDQEYVRRSSFLQTFMIDQLNSTSRPGQVYILGWTDSASTQDTLEGTNWRSVDSTLYVIKADLSITLPQAQFTVTPDLFTWSSFEREGFVYRPPMGLELFSEGVISYRFTPVEPFMLDTVESLELVLEREDNFLRETVINLWDWEASRWRAVTVDAGTTVSVANPARFIGPMNTVQVQLERRATSGRLSLTRLGIIQRGTFDVN